MNIGNYKVIKPLGEGGMGTARLAVCPKGRLVVLKSTVRDTKLQTGFNSARLLV